METFRQKNSAAVLEILGPVRIHLSRAGADPVATVISFRLHVLMQGQASTNQFYRKLINAYPSGVLPDMREDNQGKPASTLY